MIGYILVLNRTNANGCIPPYAWILHRADSAQHTPRVLQPSATCMMMYDVNRWSSVCKAWDGSAVLWHVVTRKVCIQATAMSSTERLDLGMLKNVETEWKGLEASKERANSANSTNRFSYFKPNTLHQLAVYTFSSFFYIFLTLIALLMLWPDLSPAAPSRQEGRIMSTIQHKNCCAKNS